MQNKIYLTFKNSQRQLDFLAGRWAAKEALFKAFKTPKPKLKRYDINILEKDDIPNILKYYDVACTGAFFTPSYNYFK
ncbi:4'-phosphopantetheinyl transferase superfamily protein ['Fragaria x ananassa' phyllody phytoplasma]|uniref:4'-phosphopantetheinyl transferase superfamily protein n=1 Tax='Fragaria x ananassa' phyllody phytoplasma TaxID=2358428 RepID=A0ABS5K435_9MOLU|nr:4'-phosphopantetheinyl transferase superfamily protein ['Fragaria x ananassa' phyllody phytoplasma]MBS2126549.1 4'-phosphopantetheinyl transferase superfamily protein ['Fragaria x ananassa' phyllody phytoplasma]